MAFEGDLKNLPLADVLQTINQNSLTGTLKVKDGKGERRVAFQGGLIVAFQPAPGDARPVIDWLAKRRLVAKPEAERARSGFLGKRKTLRLALAQKGLVSEDAYAKAVKEEVLEGIFDLFLETDRTFKFEDGAPDLSTWDQDQIAAELKLPSAGIVMEGARRTDEWGRIRRAIGSMNEVLVRDGEAQEGDDDITREVLELADGSRDLTALLEGLPVPRFRGCEAVAALIGARRLRPASSNEYVQLGAQAEQKGRYEEAAGLYARGLATERGNLDLRTRRAAALERANKRSEAADERKLLAAALADQGKSREASDELARAADLAPRDPVPLERRLAVLHELGEQEPARVVLARLAALYEDLGLGDKARDLLRAQVARAADDELRTKLAELLARQGDARGAAKEWSELAAQAMRKEQLALAASFYRKALEADPQDQTAQALLKDIETGALVARRARRARLFRLVLATLVVAATAGWVSREGLALQAYQRVHLETGYERVASGTPEGVADAAEAALAVRDAWPYTLASRQADALVLKLVDVFGGGIARARAESSLRPRLRTTKVASDAETLGRLRVGLDEAAGSASLEQLALEADALVARADASRPGPTRDELEKAAATFRRAQDRIKDAVGVFAETSDAARHQPELKAFVERVDRAWLHVRVGRLRCLPLSTEARARLEATVVVSLPKLEEGKK